MNVFRFFPENVKVKFLDFQMMNTFCSGVIDLGYFTYVMTDKEFRTQHLEACLKEYHEVLKGYLDFEQSFKEFMEEFNDMRPMYFFGIMVRKTILRNLLSLFSVFIWTFSTSQACCFAQSPEKIEAKEGSLDMLGEMIKQAEELLLRPGTEGEHPNLTGMKRRFREAIIEFDELGVFNAEK